MATVLGFGQTLLRLREQAGLTQGELAKKLTVGPSRISRVESEEIGVTTDEVIEIVDAIATPEAKEYAEFLNAQWKITERPGFKHPSKNILWHIESTLQDIQKLKSDPELKNAFVKQLDLCEEQLRRTSGFLLSTEHPIAFIGSPGVGKTTAICVLANLRDHTEKDIPKQMVLQTGSGRTTSCEVHVKNGPGYSISVEPCSEDDLRSHVADFCEYLLGGIRQNIKDTEGSGISVEILRVLRNMTGLHEKKIKMADNKFRREDPALDLARQFPTKDELQIQILSKLNLPWRNRTTISFPRDSSLSGLTWLGKTFAEINYGKHPEFSLPRRVEVTTPMPVLSSTTYDLRLIDTRGVDEPSVPRRDLQAYLDDPRTVIVLCSAFNDAPNAAVQAVIERAIAGGLKDAMANRTSLLVLPREKEEVAVKDGSGMQVESASDGRELRRDQIQETTLNNLGVRDLPIVFMDLFQKEDADALNSHILEAVQNLRIRAEKQAENLVTTVTTLIANRENEQAKAVFMEATKPIRVWLDSNGVLPTKDQAEAYMALIEEISAAHASSVRASVARKGNWYNLDYYHGLGFGARRETVQRAEPRINNLKVIAGNPLADTSLSDAHGFLRQYLEYVDSCTSELFQTMQAVGETAFAEQLRGDHEYWKECYTRWGQGPGYKSDISVRTKTWFGQEGRKDVHLFLESEVQRRWKDMMTALRGRLESASPSQK